MEIMTFPVPVTLLGQAGTDSKWSSQKARWPQGTKQTTAERPLRKQRLLVRVRARVRASVHRALLEVSPHKTGGLWDDDEPRQHESKKHAEADAAESPRAAARNLHCSGPSARSFGNGAACEAFPRPLNDCTIGGAWRALHRGLRAWNP